MTRAKRKDVLYSTHSLIGILSKRVFLKQCKRHNKPELFQPKLTLPHASFKRHALISSNLELFSCIFPISFLFVLRESLAEACGAKEIGPSARKEVTGLLRRHYHHHLCWIITSKVKIITFTTKITTLILGKVRLPNQMNFRKNAKSFSIQIKLIQNSNFRYAFLCFRYVFSTKIKTRHTLKRAPVVITV